MSESKLEKPGDMSEVSGGATAAFGVLFRAINDAMADRRNAHIEARPTEIVSALITCAWSVADAMQVDFVAVAISVCAVVTPDKGRVLAAVHAAYATANEERPS